jgi:hypothetical protein
MRHFFRLGHLCWKLSVGEAALILSALRGSNMTLKNREITDDIRNLTEPRSRTY